jgi:hypothetical protein
MNPVALVYRFVLHTLAGVFLFSIVGGVVVLLSQGTILLERYGAPTYAMLAVRGLETAILILARLVAKSSWPGASRPSVAAHCRRGCLGRARP